MSEALVVGAGPAGAIVTSRLARAGVKVTCLEQGGWHLPERFPAGRGSPASFELLARGPFSPNLDVRHLPEDYPVLAPGAAVAPLMFNGVGGSTLLYAADWSRMRPSDFRVRTLDGVADDWPLDYGTLEPYYRQTDVELNVAGLGGDPSLPPGPPPPRPPLPIGDAPATSVVDRWGAAHEVPGLHIADGSAFDTSGGVNPTSTVVALAARLADRLLASRGGA